MQPCIVHLAGLRLLWSEVMKAHCMLHFSRRPKARCHSPQCGQAWWGRCSGAAHLLDSLYLEVLQGRPGSGFKLLHERDLEKSYNGTYDFPFSAMGTSLHLLCKLFLNPNGLRWTSPLFHFLFPHQKVILSIDLHVTHLSARSSGREPAIFITCQFNRQYRPLTSVRVLVDERQGP